MSNHIDKGNGFTHHDDTDCCACPCRTGHFSYKVKFVNATPKRMVKHLQAQIDALRWWQISKRIQLKYAQQYWRQQ